MFKRKVISYAIAGFLTVGISEAGASIVGMDNQDNDDLRQTANNVTDISSHSRIQEIRDEFEKHGITLPDESVSKDEFLQNLDTDTKRKLEEFSNNLKSQNLSSEEALELRTQRISLPEKENRSDKFMKMDENVKAIAKDILDQTLKGTMTVDESIAEVTNLGITLTEQEICDLRTYFQSEANTEVRDIYNKLKSGEITEDEARGKVNKGRVNLPKSEENNTEE